MRKVIFTFCFLGLFFLAAWPARAGDREEMIAALNEQIAKIYLQIEILQEELKYLRWEKGDFYPQDMGTYLKNLCLPP